MKRIICTFLALTLLCALFAGCTPNATTEDPTEATKSSLKNPSNAVTVGQHNVSAAVLNYYYMDAITNLCNSFSSYGEYADLYLQLYYGLYTSKPLSQQIYDQATGETWANYFAAKAVNNAHWAYAMYDAAMAAGYELPEDQKKQLDSLPDTLKVYASYLAFKDVDEYLKYLYGDLSTEETYLEYYRTAWIAAEYAQHHYDEMTFHADELAAYEVGREETYNSYTYATYYIPVDKYMQYKYGAQDTYTPEQQAQALREAKELANSLAEKATSVEELDLAILKANLDSTLFAANCVEAKYTLYSNIGNDAVRSWVSDSARVAGDVSVLESIANDAVEGFYIVLYESVDENRAPLANVQHILIAGKTEDEKVAAKAKAEDILKEFQESAVQDSAAFGELAKKYTEDSASKDTGGLYENVCRNHKYVQNFENWAVAGHQPGDVGIVETDYGYHIMFYKGDGAMTYRESMIDVDLRAQKQSEWEASVLSSVTLVQEDVSCLDPDLVVNPQ